MLAWGWAPAHAEPLEESVDPVQSRLDRLASRGITRVALVTSQEETATVLEERVAARDAPSVLVVHDPLVLDDPSVAFRAAAECIVRVERREAEIESWLVGGCIGDRFPLAEEVRATIRRLNTGDALPVLPEFEPTAPMVPITTAELKARRMRIRGWQTLLAGTAVVGGTYAWYRVADGADDRTWLAMRGANSAGWLLVAGGGFTLWRARRARSELSASASPQGITVSGRI